MKNTITYKILLSILCLIFLSCEEILIEDNISDKKIELVAPVDHTNFFSTGVTFSWIKVENATKYHLQIAKPNFAAPLQIVLDTLVSSTTFTHQFNIGDYEWRVKATNSAYETSYESRFFTIVSNEKFEYNTVSLLTPSNALNTNTPLQNLSWKAIIGASSYQVQVYDKDNTVINNETVTTTSLNYTFPQGNYFWRVRANNGTQQTLYSSRSILVDTTVPNTPVLSSPADASTPTTNDVIFQWNRTPISGSVEKDLVYIYKDKALTSLQIKSEESSPFTTTITSGTYYWFVKAFDQAGNVSTQSTVFSFTVN